MRTMIIKIAEGQIAVSLPGMSGTAMITVGKDVRSAVERLYRLAIAIQGEGPVATEIVNNAMAALGDKPIITCR